jgi:hypothetical protein
VTTCCSIFLVGDKTSTPLCTAAVPVSTKSLSVEDKFPFTFGLITPSNHAVWSDSR